MVALAQGAVKCYVGTSLAGANAVKETDCDGSTCKRYTALSTFPAYTCGGSSDTAGKCTHVEAFGVLASETCICAGNHCNAPNATMEGEKKMSGAGSVRPPAIAIALSVATATALAFTSNSH